MQRILSTVALIATVALSDLRADVIANPLFSDNSVLQRQMNVPVWGTASEGEKVTVCFAGQKKEAVTTNGCWRVLLDPMEACVLPRTMTVSGSNTLTFTNLLVGEVWICSGQSNMERQLGLRPGQKPIVNAEKEAASANYPLIRHFGVTKNVSPEPLSTMGGKWSVCTPTSVTNFTAVGYYFGRDLYRDLKVPIGLIHSSWGGTPAEAWTGSGSLSTNPALGRILENYAKEVEAYPAKIAKYKSEEAALIQNYQAATAKAKEEGKPGPAAPKPPFDPPHDPHSPSGLFNAMINPLIPYAMRGVIWYQGEANASHAAEYRTLFPVMIADWRARWGEGNFPFLFVQIAPFFKMPPGIREAQLFTALSVPNTAMTVITDHGDAQDIHPAEKEPVGARLALAARALAYGQMVEYSGPLFRNAAIDGQEIVVSFTHCGIGLTSHGEPLKGFSIAAADKVFVPAHAEILGNTVVVSSPDVPEPKEVRFGWENVPDCNLFNLAGIPASPFRTDSE